ncbi:MAG: 30S ribosome-binding factor RbfA [Bacteroidota bacterium]|nr:30S ribosome-binding factor RbfA [Chitinophagaceae bacterium]MCE2758289.1 30S ribosome-binding factor RbfA [Chitinophagaceae bacterium]
MASKVTIFTSIKVKGMEESKRQKQVAGVIQEAINDIFLRLGYNMMDGGMVSISHVKLTPDLLEARIYLSLFKVNDPDALLKKFEDRKGEIKKELGLRVKQQLRRMPELKFYKDDTLDHVFRMEEIFKKINEERNS